MKLLSQVTTGKVEKPYLILIHGAPGVGKSTFAGDAPKPIFLCTEDGTSNLDVTRFPIALTFDQVLASVKELLSESHDFQTLVMDSLDHMEPLVFEAVCKEAGVDSIEKAFGGYGKGYVAALEKWRELLSLLTDLRSKRGMNIVAIAHSAVKKVDDLKEGRQYDRYTLKLNEKASALWQEFVDTILFATYEVFTKKDDQNKVRAFSSGARIALTEWRAYAVAKNRFGLAAEIPLGWESFVSAAKAGSPQSVEVMQRQISEMLAMIKDAALVGTIRDHLVKVGTDPTGLSKILNRLQTLSTRS